MLIIPLLAVPCHDIYPNKLTLRDLGGTVRISASRIPGGIGTRVVTPADLVDRVHEHCPQHVHAVSHASG